MGKIDDFSGDYFFLSNFWGPPGPRQTVEHWYQASKASTKEEQDWVLDAPTAAAAKKRGKKVQLRPDWEQIKIDVMRNLLQWKFSNPELRQLLLATGEAELIEGNWWKDTFWGVCKGVGQNWLGRLLMELRSSLKGT